MILDDGSKAVIHFNTKDNKTIGKDGTIPSVVIKITDPNGKEHKVTGAGYHDHQWVNMKHNSTWDHWIWGRQDFGDYAILIFDIGTQKKYGNKRLPMMFLEDKDGNLVMEDLKDPKCKFVEEYKEKLSGKMYPKVIDYTFTQGNKITKYKISHIEELESRDPTSQLPKIMQAALKIKGLHPSTTRNFAKGKMIYTDGTNTIEREGDMIYEFVYMGITVKGQMENL